MPITFDTMTLMTTTSPRPQVVAPSRERGEPPISQEDAIADAWWAGYSEAARIDAEPQGPTHAELANRLYQSDVPPLGYLSATVTAGAWTYATISPTPRLGPHGQPGIPPIDADAWLRIGPDGYQRILNVAHEARAYLNNQTGSSAAQRQAAMRAELRRLVKERCGDQAVALLDAVIDGSLREPGGGGVDSKVARSSVAAARFAASAYTGALVAAAALNMRVRNERPWLPVNEYGELLVWRGVRPGAA